MGLAEQLMWRRFTQYENMERDKSKLYHSPEALSKIVGEATKTHHPFIKKPREAKYAHKYEAYDEQAADTPMAGYGRDLYNNYKAALGDPRLRGVSSGQILSLVSRAMIESPDPTDPTRTRREGLSAHKLKADTSAWRLFGLLGEDTSVRKPADYEGQLARIRASDPERQDIGIPTALGMGAGAAVVGTLAKRFLAGSAMLAPIPGARIAGAALLAIPEFKIYDWVSNALSKTDYGRARKGTWEKMGADLLLGGVAPVAAGLKGYKALTKLMKQSVKTGAAGQKLLPHNFSAWSAEDITNFRNQKLLETRYRTEAQKIFNTKGFKNTVYDSLTEQQKQLPYYMRKTGHPSWAKTGEPVTTPYTRKELLEDKRWRDTFSKFDSTETEMALDLAQRIGIRNGIRTTAQYTRNFRKNTLLEALTRSDYESSKQASKWLKDVDFGTAEFEGIASFTKRRKTTKADRELLAKIRKAKKDGTYRAAVQGAKEADPIIQAPKPNIKVRPGKKKKLTAADKKLLADRKAAREAKAALKSGTKKRVAEETIDEVTWKGRLAELKKQGIIKSTTKVDDKVIAAEAKTITKKKVKLPNEEVARREVQDFHRETFNAETRLVDESGTIFSSKELEKAAGDWLAGKKSHIIKTILGVSAMASGAGLLSILSPSEAEASVLPAAARAIGKAAAKAEAAVAKRVVKGYEFGSKVGEVAGSVVKTKEQLAQEIIDKGWTAGKIKDPYQLPRAMKFMSVAEEAVNQVGKLGAVIKRTKAVKLGVGRLLSPHTIARLFFKEGLSPDLEIAHMMSAFGVNTENAYTVFNNIIKDTGILSKQSANKLILESMEGLADKYAGSSIAYSAVEGKINLLTRNLKQNQKNINKLTSKGKKKGLKDLLDTKAGWEEELTRLTAASEELAPKYKAFTQEWEGKVKELANKYSTTRISLAVEDTADFKHYPWLAKILTSEEKVAVQRVKDFYQHYAARIKEVGLDTIKARPYNHHSMHPSWTVAKGADVLDTMGIAVNEVLPYTKFHRRAMFSRQMVPDIVHNGASYIPDAERRILWRRFWDPDNPKGWQALANSNTVKGSVELSEYFQRLRDASIPAAATTGNQAANLYSAFEVGRLLAFSPSVPFKHVFKEIGTFSTLGVKQGAAVSFDALMLATRTAAKSPEMTNLYSKLGVKNQKHKYKIMDDVAHSYLHQGRLLSNLADLEIDKYSNPTFMGRMQKTLGFWNKPGSIPIRGVEHFDRATSLLAAMEMAGKRGMTAQQATIGIYSTILKNNFLSGPLNPSWMLDPKIRALFLFQNTAFKIMERRVVTAMKAGRAVKTVWGRIRPQNLRKTLTDLDELRNYIKDGENIFKKHMIADALGSERDLFGNSIVKQFMTEAILASTIIAGGAHVGLDFMPHTFHVPFLVHGRTEPTLATSPAAKSMIRIYDDWVTKSAEDRDFILTTFMKSWLGSTKGIPQAANKMLRINRNDIPAIYQDSKFQYLFSVPTYGEHY